MSLECHFSGKCACGGVHMADCGWVCFWTLEHMVHSMWVACLQSVQLFCLAMQPHVKHTVMSATLLQPLPLFHLWLPSSLYILFFIVSFTEPCLQHFLYLSHLLHISPFIHFLISWLISLEWLSKMLLFFLFWLLSLSLHSLLPFFSNCHLVSLLAFLNSDVYSKATDLFSSFEQKRTIDLCVRSKLHGVLSQTSIKTGMAAACKACKGRIFATRWLAISLAPILGNAFSQLNVLRC